MNVRVVLQTAGIQLDVKLTVVLFSWDNIKYFFFVHFSLTAFCFFTVTERKKPSSHFDECFHIETAEKSLPASVFLCLNVVGPNIAESDQKAKQSYLTNSIFAVLQANSRLRFLPSELLQFISVLLPVVFSSFSICLFWTTDFLTKAGTMTQLETLGS